MKVPIQSDETKDEAAQAEPVNDTETAAADAAEPELDPDEEAARVAEAIRRGEEAAEKELASDAGKLREERDELAKKLAAVDDDIAAAKKQAADATDRLVRLQADWDNYRRLSLIHI